MAGEDKRKGADRENTKKPKPLIKLNGKSDELYDSYGYRIERQKPRTIAEEGRKANDAAGRPARQKTVLPSSEPRKEAQQERPPLPAGRYRLTSAGFRSAHRSGKRIS